MAWGVKIFVLTRTKADINENEDKRITEGA